MNVSYTALLVASCISLPLCSMEHETFSSHNKQITLTKFHVEDIKNLYEKTYEKMETFTHKHADATKNLLEIIDHTNHLKSQGITEEQIAQIACNEKRFFKDNIEYYWTAFLDVNNGPYNGPHYISAFFTLLKSYNSLIAKKELISPTEKQCADYKKNLTMNLAVRHAASVGLSIKSTSLKEQNALTTIPETVAAKEFHTLFSNICSMRHKAPTIMEAIACALYAPVDAQK
jgi:hypothetical protein